MVSDSWPGNIRELGHVIQRSRILANGSTIDEVKLPDSLAEPTLYIKDTEMKTLEAIEAEHILGVLKKCKGKVCGFGGAAGILGPPPSTLNSKIKKLGIKRESYFNL